MARNRLLDPLKAVQVGQVFRLEYTRAALPRLQEVIDTGTPQASVNAMQVVALLGTPKALETIVSHACVEDEEDFGIRLWAAKAFGLAVRRTTLPQNEINKALRQLGHAAGREKEWLILRRQFEALATVANEVSRDVQIDVLQTVAARMDEQAGPSELMRATYPAVKLIFDEYLDLRDPAQQQAFGMVLAPILCDLCTIANNHWDQAHQDEAARDTYGGTVHISEQLLRLIDGRARPRQAGPKTELGPAWKNSDRTRFRADHAKWQAVIGRPPYRR